MIKAVLVSAVASFLAGAAAAILTQNALRSALADQHVVTGQVRYQGASDPLSSAPPPVGYYIDVETRFYVEPEEPVALGKRVTIAGKLGSQCGADGMDCYPSIVSGHASKMPPGTP